MECGRRVRGHGVWEESEGCGVSEERKGAGKIGTM